MGKADIVEVLGLSDPDGPVAPRRKSVVDYSPEAVEQRKVAARAAPPSETETKAPVPYSLLTAAMLRAMPRMTWLISGVLPVHGCIVIYGASGSGKTFLWLDMVAALGDGSEWFGHKVRKSCRVVVVVLEGEAGIAGRVEAWEQVHGRGFPESVRFIFQPFALTDGADVLALAGAIDAEGGADVILVDTLNRAAPGSDENSSRDMGLILEGTKDLQALTGALVALVHHVGKDATKGMRGHSSLFAALDAAIEVSRTDARREWSIAKNKDGSDGEVHPFRLDVVDLGEDEDGEPITSCVVRTDVDGTASAPRLRLPKGGNQRIVYDALGPLLRESSAFGRAGAPAIRPCIELEAAILTVRERLTVEPNRRTERAREAIKGLVSRGVVGCNEGWLWLI